MSVVCQILYPETAARSLGGKVFGSCTEVTGFEVKTKQASVTETSSLHTVRWSRARVTGTPPYHLPEGERTRGRAEIKREFDQFHGASLRDEGMKEVSLDILWGKTTNW